MQHNNQQIDFQAVITHHSQDLDGYMSGICAIKFIEDLEPFIRIKTIPVNYNMYSFEKIEGLIKKSKQKNIINIVFVLDFCFLEQEMFKLLELSDVFIFIDHHEGVKSIVSNLENYIENHNCQLLRSFSSFNLSSYLVDLARNREKIGTKLKPCLINFNPDPESSEAACYLTYKSLFMTDPPNVIKYASEIDTYQISSPETIYFREFIDNCPWRNYTFLKELVFKNKLLYWNNSFVETDEIISNIGKLMREKKEQQVENNLERFVRGYLKFEDRIYSVCVCNSTNGSIKNEIMNGICKREGCDIGIIYYDNLIQNSRIFSLRTLKDDVPLHIIAKKIGNGGGHQKAVGFSLPLDEGVKFVNQLLGVVEE